jgi:hypothetical protein
LVMLTLPKRIDSMFSKRCFNGLAMSLILTIFIYCGVQLVICQDSAKTWKDNATGLMWSVMDNGMEVPSNQAGAYCKSLSLDGYKDWRLPTDKELDTIYDKNLSKDLKVKGPIKLSSDSVWGSSTNSQEAWLFSFYNGGATIAPLSGGTCSSKATVLCVRRPKE